MKPSLLLLVVAGLVSACDAGTPIATEASAPVPAAAMGGLDPQELSPGILRDLARARAATARFQRHDAADELYNVIFMDICMENQPTGGMGYHYVNFGLVNGTVEVEHPEALMYEPGPNGQLRLVGLEYVIPKDLWTSPNPPVLFGQEFTLNQFDLWALHVWIWKNNPSGIFADWNPNVSCENAVSVGSVGRTHH